MERLEKRFLGLDFGDKTVGVALSDSLGMLAHGVETIRRKKPTKLRQTLSRIEELVREHEVGLVVLGLPLLADGTEGARCERTREFGAMLSERLSIPVVYQDERLTTVEAYEWMEKSGIPESERQEKKDEISAVIILQDYMKWKRLNS